MNKTTAKKIAQSGITYGQIKDMLKRAYDAGAANDTVSNVNPGCTKSVCFNILWKGHAKPDDTTIKSMGDIIGAKNALWEFGDFWDGDISKFKPTRKKASSTNPFHQEPIDIYEDMR